MKITTKKIDKSLNSICNDFPGLWYKNHTGLLSDKYDILYTHEEITDILECSRNPIYFAEKYIKILDSEGSLVNIKLTSWQKEILSSILNEDRVINYGHRQTGLSLITKIAVLHSFLFRKNGIVMLSQNLSTTGQLSDSLIRMIQHLPLHLKPRIKTLNKKEIVSVRSKIKFGLDISKLYSKSKEPIDYYVDNAGYFDDHRSNIITYLNANESEIGDMKIGKMILSTTGGSDGDSFVNLMNSKHFKVNL